ncbi:hypothetical protein [Lederbergia ruris]|uniref:hypothetical protein n=1 Tax=Lederbergia ruris TaxID=217495 RepID=UPI0039A31426
MKIALNTSAWIEIKLLFNTYGNAPSHLLFDKINIKKKDEVNVPRSSTDYQVLIDRELPNGVTLHEIVTF